MANIAKWSSTTLTTVMSTELNSAANNSFFTSSSAYSNNTGLDVFCDIEVFLNSMTPGRNTVAIFPWVSIYLMEAVDGTDYPAQSGTDPLLTLTHLIARIPVGTSTSTSQRVVFRGAVIPPGSFNVGFENQLGVNMNASGNTVKFLTYDANLNG